MPLYRLGPGILAVAPFWRLTNRSKYASILMITKPPASDQRNFTRQQLHTGIIVPKPPCFRAPYLETKTIFTGKPDYCFKTPMYCAFRAEIKTIIATGAVLVVTLRRSAAVRRSRADAKLQFAYLYG